MSTARPTSGRRGEGAFTLLEVMVAVVFLAVAVTAIFRLQSSSVLLAARTKFETTAPLLAQKKMAELMMKDPAGLASDTGDFGDDHPLYYYKVEVVPVESELMGETGQRLRKIMISVYFGEEKFTYTLTGLRLVNE
ncbi:MAG: hypothetical protein AB1921_19680 [Thermodesulfobacteriota bacterium]